MKKLLFAMFGALLMGCASNINAPIPSNTTFARDALKPFVESGELPGAVSVFYKNGIQEVCAIGYADVAAKRAITPDDVFMQCSQTKGFCGVTIAKLIEDGLINLDDPVSRYLPEFATLWILNSETNGIRTLVKAKNALTIRMCQPHRRFSVRNLRQARRCQGRWMVGRCPDTADSRYSRIISDTFRTRNSGAIFQHRN